MLQRAASNAYTWWWASHIRTNQSKWLDNNLQEMEEKVKRTLGLIEEDADSFRKKAEMYYQRRPELIEFVQEAYKSYRALAERYDHLSGELHKANNTIASVYPDQVHFGMDDVDEDSGGVPSESRPPSHPRKAKMAKPPIPNQPMSDMSKETSGATTGHSRKASQMNVVEAEEEIDKLQKEILSLQTEKVFVKSSYERGMANYMEIERKITETQERVCNLQDEFSAMSIDDDEARAVMVATALKSCEDTLVSLNEQQHKCNGDAKVEFERIRSVKDRIKQLGFESLSKSSNNNNKKSDPVADSNIAKSISKNSTETNPSNKDNNIGDDLGRKIEKRIQVKDYCEKIRGTLEQQSEMCVMDLAETIDDLVNKVINLEATVSSYESQIERLRLETDEAHKKLDSINASSGDLADADDDKDKKKSVVKKTVDELAIIDELERSIRNQGSKLHIEFRNTYKFFFDLSRNLDKEEIDFPFEMVVEEEEQQQEMHDQEQVDEQEGLHIEEEEKEVEEKEKPKSQKDDKETEVETKVELREETKEQENLIAMESISLGKKSLGRSHAAKDLDVSFKGKQQGGEGDEVTEQGTPSNWQHLFLDGLEDREKILLAEYTSVLRNYRETRKKLTEAEKKNQEHLFKSVSQMKQLRNAFLKKDEEIQSLKNRLSLMEAAGMDESLPKSEEETSNINKEAAATATATASDINRAKLPSKTMSSIPLEINMEILDMVGKDLVDQINAQSRVPTVEERFRKDIDNLLDENLEFWLRFSSSFQQIQKYQLEVEQLHCKILGLKQHAATTTTTTTSSSCVDHHNPSHSPATMTKRSEASLIYKHLKDLESDLSVWIEQNALLKEELQGRCTSLEGIATEIERVSKKGMEGDEFKFTDFQASKFQGEVINMQQENNKVANELQSGLDHVRLLQSELEKALAKLHEIEPSSKSNHANPHYQQIVRMASTPGGKPKIPLRSFLFGVKPKPKKTSIFSCMNQAFLQKQYSDLRPGLPH